MSTITIGDKQYPARALNFRQLRELAKPITTLVNFIAAMDLGKATPSQLTAFVATGEGSAAVMAVVGAALQRADANVDLATVEEALDMENVLPVIRQALGISGLETDPKKAAVPAP